MTRLLVAALVLLGACAAHNPSAAEVVTLDVAPTTVACMGEAPQRCLLVRTPSEQAWTRFYGTIEGFTHEEGYRYRIEVDRQRVARPPADGSSYRYRLLRVLSKVRDAGGG
jgi:hypothetical protein